MSFHTELIRLRESADLTQEELAVKTGITRSLISHLELGIRPPQVECLTQLADCFGLDGAERQRFLDLGYIAHMPEVARAHFSALDKRLHAAEARLHAAEARLNALQTTIERNAGIQ